MCRDQPIEANGEQIKAGEVTGGRCAVVGSTDNLEPAALCLYRDWLPASGEEARDFPILLNPNAGQRFEPTVFVALG